MSNTHHHPDHVGDHDHDDEQNDSDCGAGGETAGGETADELSVRRESRLRVAMWLNIAIVAVQVVFGFIAHSLGLIADASHNLTDVAAVVAIAIGALIAVTSRRLRGSGCGFELELEADADCLVEELSWGVEGDGADDGVVAGVGGDEAVLLEVAVGDGHGVAE